MIFEAPLIRAIWPTDEPVAPAAPETTTTSPSFMAPTSNSPAYAVTPVVPSTFIATGISIPSGNGDIDPMASSATAYSCHPVSPETMSPTL